MRAGGTGFLPIEHVQVTAKGKTVNTVANAQRNFVVSLPSVSNCGSATAVAAGDEGSHAEFNLSQTVWLGNQ